MDLFQKLVERDLTNLAHKSPANPMFNNLTGPEKVSLRNLSEDDSIVIRNADKGGSVVVLDSGVNRTEAICQLSYPETYLSLKSDPTQSFSKIIILNIR